MFEILIAKGSPIGDLTNSVSNPVQSQARTVEKTRARALDPFKQALDIRLQRLTEVRRPRRVRPAGSWVKKPDNFKHKKPFAAFSRIQWTDLVALPPLVHPFLPAVVLILIINT